MNIILVSCVYIMLVHWVADFCLQTDEQARGKSKSVSLLTQHVLTYSVIWFFASFIMFLAPVLVQVDLRLDELFLKSCIFTSITFVAHWLTDYCTSRIGKPYWEKKDYHNGFVVVGFDQVLHYTQLYITANWLINLTL